MRAVITSRSVIVMVMLLLLVGCSTSDEPSAVSDTVVAQTPVPTVVKLPKPTVVGFEPVPTPTPVTLEPTPTPVTLEPTPTPVTLKPTPTPTSTPLPAISAAELAALRDSVHIKECRIAGDLVKYGYSGSGTAPGPTPTQAPLDRSRTEDLVRRETSEVRQHVDPISTAVLIYSRGFEEAWPNLDTPSDQAEHLHVLGNRLAQLCAAVSQIDIPPESLTQISSLAESIRARHAWTILTLEQLLKYGDGRSEFTDVGRLLTFQRIEDTTASLDSFFTDGQIDEVAKNRTVTSDQLGLTFEIVSGDVVIRNGIDLFISLVDAPAVFEFDSLGPDGWDEGAAVRVRRLRNRSDISLDQAGIDNAGLINRYGSVTRIESINIPELDSVEYSYQFSEPWFGSVIVFISANYTYMVDSVCQNIGVENCERTKSIVESLRFIE